MICVRHLDFLSRFLSHLCPCFERYPTAGRFALLDDAMFDCTICACLLCQYPVWYDTLRVNNGSTSTPSLLHFWLVTSWSYTSYSCITTQLGLADSAVAGPTPIPKQKRHSQPPRDEPQPPLFQSRWLQVFSPFPCCSSFLQNCIADTILQTARCFVEFIQFVCILDLGDFRSTEVLIADWHIWVIGELNSPRSEC